MDARLMGVVRGVVGEWLGFGWCLAGVWLELGWWWLADVCLMAVWLVSVCLTGVYLLSVCLMVICSEVSVRWCQLLHVVGPSLTRNDWTVIRSLVHFSV